MLARGRSYAGDDPPKRSEDRPFEDRTIFPYRPSMRGKAYSDTKHAEFVDLLSASNLPLQRFFDKLVDIYKRHETTVWDDIGTASRLKSSGIFDYIADPASHLFDENLLYANSLTVCSYSLHDLVFNPSLRDIFDRRKHVMTMKTRICTCVYGMSGEANDIPRPIEIAFQIIAPPAMLKPRPTDPEGMLGWYELRIPRYSPPEQSVIITDDFAYVSAPDDIALIGYRAGSPQYDGAANIANRWVMDSHDVSERYRLGSRLAPT